MTFPRSQKNFHCRFGLLLCSSCCQSCAKQLQVSSTPSGQSCFSEQLEVSGITFPPGLNCLLAVSAIRVMLNSSRYLGYLQDRAVVLSSLTCPDTSPSRGELSACSSAIRAVLSSSRCCLILQVVSTPFPRVVATNILTLLVLKPVTKPRVATDFLKFLVQNPGWTPLVSVLFPRTLSLMSSTSVMNQTTSSPIAQISI